VVDDLLVLVVLVLNVLLLPAHPLQEWAACM
jgi:hypothetical protein